MKIITNKRVVQKIVIAILIVILTTFCIPVQSHADAGGKIMNPLIQLVAALFDGAQHLLEMTMLGRTESFMDELGRDYEVDSAPSGDNVKEVDEFIDATFFGINAINIPTITYTPEEIFSNKVPALDINFINPSITKSADGKHDDEVRERNVAVQLRETIAGWYNALTIIAMIGLLSVLVYLGIRMLLSSIAADRAKYKQMLMDWVVAMCLLFTLHFIMSFALTMVETVTAMLSSGDNNTSIIVYATKMDALGINNYYSAAFETNLMNYVRFMVQAGDLSTKLGFLGLYIMLVIYSIRFTWIYLKRVINMAFLTLIAPMVALTYPIDKVSDGKAQAFNMWLKEFTYNALIQPIHLLLYKILLGSAIDIAADNPLYAIAALGFIIAAEKMVKQMFGFGKASGGTVASLAGAAGVTAFASKMLSNAGKKVAAGAGGNGKVRTKDVPERQGKDNGANKPFDAFNGRNPGQLVGAGSTRPAPDPSAGPAPDPGGPVPDPGGPGQQQEDPNNEERLRMEEQLAQYDETDPYFMDPAHQELQRQYQELRESENATQEEAQGVNAPEGDPGLDVPSPEEYNNPFDYQGPREPDNFFDVVGRDVGAFSDRQFGRLKSAGDFLASTRTVEGRRNIKNKIKGGLNNAAIGAWKAAPAVAYKAARGTARLGAAALMAGAGLAIGATTGSGEQALSMAAAAGTVGFTTGDNIFDATVGRAVRDPGNISDAFKDAYGASKYGNAVDARNARADKEYVRSTKFDDFYEKEIKGKYRYSKDEFKKIATSYRQSGITAESEIKKAMKLEAYYQKNNANHLNEEDIRSQVQNIVAGYKELDSSQMKAFSGDKKAEDALRKELLVMLGGDTEANRAYVDTIYQGYKDYRTQT